MERAGAGVARAVEVHAADGPVAVVCGKGNNGGDGLVVARLLREAGWEVAVVCVAPLDALSGDARENLERLPGDRPVALAEGASAIASAAVTVDALLGTGFEGEPRGETAKAIDALNDSAAPVVSVDVPSGVDASSGVVSAQAVDAAVTVTFHAAKPGLWIRPGKSHAGEVHAIDIGIPRGAPSAATIGLIAPSVRELLPRRGAESTKFASGQVVVAGGSRGLTGAPCMASRASMRAGAGYVTACVPASLQDVIAGAGTAELMTRGLAELDGALAPAAVEQAIEAIRPGGALALGPGLGRSDGAVAFARELARGPKRRWCSTPTGSTRTPGASASWPADATRRSSRRTPASWRGCWSATARRSSASACATRARPPSRRRRWSCSRATTRSSPIPTGAWR